MPTESSAVSNLIRDLNTRRLRTDPGDVRLFQPPPSTRTPRARAAGAARWFEEPPPPPAPAPVQPERRPAQPERKRPARPSAPSRNRTWLVMALFTVTGALGIGCAA